MIDIFTWNFYILQTCVLILDFIVLIFAST